jgi:hypothetical protein
MTWLDMFLWGGVMALLALYGVAAAIVFWSMAQPILRVYLLIVFFASVLAFLRWALQ